jgi:serine protease inhibitor
MSAISDATNSSENQEDQKPDVDLTVAAQIFGNRNIQFKDRFEDAQKLNFGNKKSVDTINTWFKQETNGKVFNVISSLKADDAMLFLSAIYFKGGWTNAFDPKRTKKEDFYLCGGDKKQVKVPMMRQRGNFKYLEADGYTMVALPYGVEERVQMIILMPLKEAGCAIEPMIDQMDFESFNQLTKQLNSTDFEKRSGKVIMPKMWIREFTNLNVPLMEMGMVDAFDPSKANFNRLTDSKAHVSNVLHKAIIEVTEKGTEAAVKPTGNGKGFEFVVNRPFVFAVVDTHTGLPLFLGSVQDAS